MPPVREDADATIALGHDQAEMQRLSDWIDRRIGALGLSEAAAHAVRLCLEEAVLNVITHNDPPDDPATPIRVWLGRRDGELAATVEDGSRAFDPLAVPPPDPVRDLATARIGGLGLPLMRRFSRKIAYRREPGANLLSFRFDG